MESDPRRSLRRSTRLGALAVLVACAALVPAGCITVTATPKIIWVTLPPAPPGPTVSPSIAVPSGTPAPSGTLEPTATPAPSATATAPAAAPSVSSTTVANSAPDHRWNVTFRKPVVSGVAPAAANAMNNSITTRVNAYISSFNGSSLPVVASGDGPSTLNGNFSVAFSSPSLLSVRFTIETYVTGAAHPSTEAGSISFDVASGAVIQLPDLFTTAAAALPVLQTEAHAKLAALLGADLLWPASVTMADFGKAWVFTPAGLELTWSQSVIASTAAGTPTISIAWSALSSVIATPGPAAGFVP